jgi:hypothetical protein
MAASRFLPVAVALAGLVSGCASSGSFPSLAPRPEELRPQTDAVEAAPAPPPPLDPATARRVEALIDDARRGDSAFQAALAPTERAVAAAGAAGSDNWIEAQQALSRLEAARSPTAVAAADLDSLARARVEAVPAAANSATGPIATAMSEITALIARQDQTIARLTRAIAQP